MVKDKHERREDLLRLSSSDLGKLCLLLFN
jgi:hypothetical protein